MNFTIAAPKPNKLGFPIYTVNIHNYLCSTPIILQNSLWTIKRFHFQSHFVENLHENMIFVPHLSSNLCFCTDLDRSPLHEFKFSAILGISLTQLAQVSNDRYVQESHGTMILIPSPLPSEISHISNALPLWHLIFINFTWSVLSDQSLILFGKANRLKKLPRL